MWKCRPTKEGSIWLATSHCSNSSLLASVHLAGWTRLRSAALRLVQRLNHYSQSNIASQCVLTAVLVGDGDGGGGGTKLTLPSSVACPPLGRIFKTSHHCSICPRARASRVKPDYTCYTGGVAATRRLGWRARRAACDICPRSSLARSASLTDTPSGAPTGRAVVLRLAVCLRRR